MTTKPRRAQILGLLGWLAACFAAAAIGGAASINAPSFYAQLERPAWAPPAWLFGPVWSLLYFLMAIAAWLVWRKDSAKGRETALAIFTAQLCANALWSWVFFAWRSGAWAFAEILLLLALIAWTVAAFWRIQRGAAMLLLPYFGWVSFAAALTWALWRANPGLL